VVKLGRLLLPALRWDAEHGFGKAMAEADRAIELGVGGFILFGGDAEAVRDLTSRMHARSPHPLLIGSDLERGAGQQFRGATPLPPAAALGALDEEDTVSRAAELTAREARALGVNWVYAPLADVDLEPDNPIIGTRSFGTDPARVASMVGAWVSGCTRGGALSCAKHFPGHGRTVGDSHIERPSVSVTAGDMEADLEPFRAAIAARVDAMMTAHVSYPGLDPSGAPATLSKPILDQLLRRDMGFEGMVVTDALIMEGFIEDLDEGAAAVMAMNAGCDVLLYPQDTAAVITALESALASGALPERRVEEALGRMSDAAERVAGPPEGEWGTDDDRRWALETAVRTMRVIRGNPSLPAGPVRMVEIEDDAGGPYPAYPRTAFPAALRRAGVELNEQGSPLIVIYCDIRAWKGRPGLSPAARERVAELMASSPEAPVILFSHPRLAAEIPAARHLLAAWGGESLMQEAAVAWLTGATGGLPTAASGLDR
jgi:beta-glucosidase-like glycosyl hydrolase